MGFAGMSAHLFPGHGRSILDRRCRNHGIETTTPTHKKKKKQKSKNEKGGREKNAESQSKRYIGLARGEKGFESVVGVGGKREETVR